MKRASNWEMGPAMIKSRQISNSKHMLKFGTGTTFLLHRDLQQSENQIPSWILDIKKVSRLFSRHGRFRFACLPFSSFDASRCMRIKGTGSDSKSMQKK